MGPAPLRMTPLLLRSLSPKSSIIEWWQIIGSDCSRRNEVAPHRRRANNSIAACRPSARMSAARAAIDNPSPWRVGARVVGLAVGATDEGAWVGPATDEGEVLGALLGDALGDAVGASVEGERVGTPLGDTVVGVEVGASVGVTVGDAEGDSVSS